jgi:D-ribose pyranase
MKKTGIINGPISAVIAHLGHTDMLTLADAGLPVPATTQRIDLALKPGVPGFLEALEVILGEMFVERAYVSEDIFVESPQIYAGIQQLLGDAPIEALPHSDFKELTASTKAVVRTGEFTPYSNVILVAGAWGFKLKSETANAVSSGEETPE